MIYVCCRWSLTASFMTQYYSRQVTRKLMNECSERSALTNHLMWADYCFGCYSLPVWGNYIFVVIFSGHLKMLISGLLRSQNVLTIKMIIWACFDRAMKFVKTALNISGNLLLPLSRFCCKKSLIDCDFLTKRINCSVQDLPSSVCDIFRFHQA